MSKGGWLLGQFTELSKYGHCPSKLDGLSCPAALAQWTGWPICGPLRAG
jgi:hypothetical protein